jgi:hemerythrin
MRLLNVDHRQIERLIEELHVAVAFGLDKDRDKGLDKDRTTQLLRRLSGLARTHFALEEGMMSATDYPGIAAHRRSHQLLLQQLDGFISLFLKGSLSLNRDSLSFLFVWHSTHSHKDDARYADWLVLRDAGICHESFLLPSASPGALA